MARPTINFKIPAIGPLKRFAKPTFEEENKELKDQLVKVRASDIMRFEPRHINTATGGVSKIFPTGVNYQTLRELADFYPIARACIEHRKSQITQLDWAPTPIKMNKEVFDSKEVQSDMKEIRKRLKKPMGKDESTFTNWIKQILEDLLVLDVVAIYRRRNRAKEIIGYLPIDAATIDLALLKDGTLPEPPRKAYIQKIQGQIQAKLSTDELIYRVMTPRTFSPFGLAPLETLVITVSTALKVQAFNLAYLTEGNVPEGFVELPQDIASSRDQFKEWQDAWDAMLSGDPRFQRKLKFLPEGMKYHPTKQIEDMTFERFEKWLLQNTCAVFGVQPNSIGFNFETNRSTSETSFEVSKERGLFPTAQFIKEFMDGIIQDDWGYEEMNFTWTNINPTNKLEEAKTVTSLVSKGLMAIDEWRIGENLRPIGLEEPFIETPVGPIFVKDLAAQSKSGQMPILPYKPVSEATAASAGAGEGSVSSPNVPPQAKSKTRSKEVLDELKKWKKVAVNDLNLKKAPRDFKTEVIDLRAQDLIRRELKNADSKEKIEKIFEPFVRIKQDMMHSFVNLYDELNRTVRSKESKKSNITTNIKS